MNHLETALTAILMKKEKKQEPDVKSSVQSKATDTTDAVRLKCRELLANALKIDSK